MNTISLCCTSNNPNPILLDKMLNSAQGFDEILLHINGKTTPTDFPDIQIPSNVKEILLPYKTLAGSGYNVVVSQATSEWVSCMGDDDFFHVDNLKELLTWFKHTNITEDIVQFPCFTGNDNIDWRIWGETKVTYETLRQHNMLAFSCFYRKSLWEKIGCYDDLLFNDWFYYLKALKSGASIYQWQKPIYYFRQAVDERLSDRERNIQPIEITTKQLLERLDNENI